MKKIIASTVIKVSVCASLILSVFVRSASAGEGAVYKSGNLIIYDSGLFYAGAGERFTRGSFEGILARDVYSKPGKSIINWAAHSNKNAEFCMGTARFESGKNNTINSIWTVTSAVGTSPCYSLGKIGVEYRIDNLEYHEPNDGG